MTKTTLRHSLKICGWTAILATFLEFVLNMVVKSQRMSELGMNGDFQSHTYAMYSFGYGIMLPMSLTIACLCLMASRTLASKQQTLKTVFE